MIVALGLIFEEAKNWSEKVTSKLDFSSPENGQKKKKLATKIVKLFVSPFCEVMLKTVDISADDEVFFEYRKNLAEGEPHKHRHSMIAVKRVQLDPECELKKHTKNLEHAHLLMLKVVRN